MDKLIFYSIMSNEALPKNLINKVNLVFTASESIEAFRKAKQSLTKDKVNDNLLDCSDAHHYSDSSDKDRIGNCFTWIKADPTFEGLKQILREPEDRVYIGALPPKLEAVRDNATVYLSQVSIKKKDGATIEDIWFDNDIPLNVGMVSIIGNKGSGKSALADILALAGNSHREDKDFSFLTKDRFRKDKKANDFEVTLTFEDETTVPKFLSDNSNTDDVEQVHYIPQAYIERVCTDIEGKQFQSELRRVIFSHLPDDYKLGQETLDALIEHKTKGIYNRIDNHNLQLSQLNSEIIALEEKTTSEYKDKLQSELKQKERELDAHRKSKPAVVNQPQTTGDSDVKDFLEKERENLSNINEQIENNKLSLMNLANQIDIAKSLEQKITDFDNYYNKLVKETKVGFEELEINFSEIINYSLNKSIILQKLSDLTTEKININNTLNEEEDSSLIGQKNAILKNIETYQERLDGPNKAYQLFLHSQKKWELSDNGIKNAIAEIKSKIEYAENRIEIDLQLKKEERKKVTHDIHAALSEIKAIYKELYAPVQELIKNGILFREDFKLAFDSSIFEKSFNVGFFDFISHAARGSFTGKEEGIRLLEVLKDGIDFNKSDDAVFFVEKVMEALQKDIRPEHGQFLNIKTQLKKDKTVNKLYDYLWALDYLKPDYSLKLDGKDLEQLSPGERGTLLLVFYLLVDKSNKPIIIDQPEENLDNQTIYNILIPVIKAAKKCRQIIMVTHNPNLAVVCDSEQIIHASIDKKDGNRVTYISGSIESPEINKHLIDVLEGTRPAFDNRNSKYRP
jgi:ABC-type lipoprotein export system ATPase subunit